MDRRCLLKTSGFIDAQDKWMIEDGKPIAT